MVDIIGTSASEFLQGLTEEDSILAGEGNDTIFGNVGNDFLQGNQGRDSILGELGNDTLRGGRDDDTLLGGISSDLLYGDLGNDFLQGNQDNDTLYGREGGDTLRGGQNDDVLYGGDPSLQGDNGDLLYGDAGNDFLQGNQTNDTLFGGSGNDTLRGGMQDDFLSGDVGNDTLHGDKGNNTLTGGSGSDQYVIRPDTNTTDVITDFTSGESDRIVLSEFTSITKFKDLTITTGGDGNDGVVALPDNQTLIVRDFINLGEGHFAFTSSGGTPPTQNAAPVNTVPSGPLAATEFTSHVINGLSVADVDTTTMSSVLLETTNGTLSLNTGVAGGVTALQVGGNGTNYVLIRNATKTQLNNTFADANGVTHTPFSGSAVFTVTSNDGQATDQDNVAITMSQDANLQGYWRFDETSGNVASDSSSNGNNGMLQGVMGDEDWVQGKIGSALDFDGNGDGILVNSHPSLEGFSSITLAAWVNPRTTAASDGSRIISKTDGGTRDDYALTWGNTSSPGNPPQNQRIRERITTSSLVNHDPANDLPLDQWTHVASFFDGVQMRTYINGIDTGTFANQSGTIQDSNQQLGIGQNPTAGNSRRFNGLIDEVRIYDRALTPAQITALFDSGDEAPTAALDAFSMVAGTSLVIGTLGLLANDTDPENDSLTAFLIANPARGTLNLQTDGSFTYTPNVGFSGVDTFNYKATDGTLVSNTATVTMTVNTGATALTGGAGNDSFTGSTGSDTLTGNAGQDTIVLGSDGVQDDVRYVATTDGAAAGASTGQDTISGFDVGTDKIMFGNVFNGGATDLDDITADDNFTFAADTAPNYTTTNEALLRTGLANADLTEVNFASLVTNLNTLGLTAASGESALIVAQAATQTGVYLYIEDGTVANNISAGELTLLGISNGQLTTADFDFF